MDTLTLEPEAVPPGTTPRREAPPAAPPRCPARYGRAHRTIFCILEEEHDAETPKPRRVHKGERGFSWVGFNNDGRR